ncbi:MAG: hypothetical protein ACRDTF_18505 [Pseudonocardiaceae bacterium]
MVGPRRDRLRRRATLRQGARPPQERQVLAAAPAVAEAIAIAETELGETGRILLRASGTEQQVRVGRHTDVPPQYGPIRNGGA